MKNIALSLIKKDEEIFLVKRRFEPYANFWSFSGGNPNKKEPLEISVIRETKEETGLDIKIIKKQGEFVDKNTKIHIYYCNSTSKEYNIDNIECLDGRWFNIDKVLNPKFNLIPKLKEYLI